MDKKFASAAAAGARTAASVVSTGTPASSGAGTPVSGASSPSLASSGPSGSKNGGTNGANTPAASGLPAKPSAWGAGSPLPGTSPKPAAGSGTASPAASSTPTITSAGAAGTQSENKGKIDWVLGLPVKLITQDGETFEGEIYTYDVTLNCVVLQTLSKTTSASSTPSTYYSPSFGSNSTPRPRFDFKILKISHVKEITPLASIPPPRDNASAATSPNTDNEGAGSSSSTSTSPTLSTESANNSRHGMYATAAPAIGYVQIDKIVQRERQAVRDAQAAAARIGVGVTSEGQEIFDALSKTYVMKIMTWLIGDMPSLPCRWAKDSIVVMDEVIIAPPYDAENCKANASSSNSLARVRKVLEGVKSRIANGRR
ncbi:hypothetical protein BGZ73_007430 [Actinomortierella ambigua]|nr:hypothetical protein BGZ73_007430 [Actinomortierella ambigua]